MSQQSQSRADAVTITYTPALDQPRRQRFEPHRDEDVWLLVTETWNGRHWQFEGQVTVKQLELENIPDDVRADGGRSVVVRRQSHPRVGLRRTLLVLAVLLVVYVAVMGVLVSLGYI